MCNIFKQKSTSEIISKKNKQKHPQNKAKQFQNTGKTERKTVAKNDLAKRKKFSITILLDSCLGRRMLRDKSWSVELKGFF